MGIIEVFGIALAIIAVIAIFLYPPIAKQPQKLLTCIMVIYSPMQTKAGNCIF